MPPSSEPTQPDAADSSADDADQPPPIRLAVRLMWSGAALSLIVLAIGVLASGATKRTIADELRARHTYSQHNVDTVYQNVIASTVVVAVLAAVTWAWMAHANGAGKKWARLVATVLGAVNIGQFVLSMTSDGFTAVQLVLTGASVALAAVVLYLLWRPESTYFYLVRSHRI